jgi:hypothetical protein
VYTCVWVWVWVWVWFWVWVCVLIQVETGSRWRCEDSSSTTDDSSEFSTDNSSVGNLAPASR